MASADKTFALHGFDAEIPVTSVGGEPLLIDGTVGTWEFDVTNPKETVAVLKIAVSVTGFSEGALDGVEIRRPNASNLTYPAAGLTYPVGHTERVSVKVTFATPRVDGHKGGLRLVVTEA